MKKLDLKIESITEKEAISIMSLAGGCCCCSLLALGT
jgi:hypothetical protein